MINARFRVLPLKFVDGSLVFYTYTLGGDDSVLSKRVKRLHKDSIEFILLILNDLR
ncbi:MAG: hypothetical protein ACFFCM_08535 [Promethearchaeota archaeon]